jgi:RHS repeat-associated protein
MRRIAGGVCLAMVVAVWAVILSQQAGWAVAETCTFSQGYWSQHPNAWPVTALTLGNPANPAHLYSQSELRKILGSSAKGDASLILAQQEIAAKLNIARGSNPAPVASTLTTADNLLGAFPGKLPDRVAPGSSDGSAMVSAAGRLQDYNLGVLPHSCGAGNTAPTANAGLDQTVSIGATVTLNGGGSSDPDGDALTFTWTLISKPVGSVAALSDPHAVQPTFVADASGSYNVQLVVNDGTADSAADTVRISTLNSRPVANAGPDQSLAVTSVAQLDGSASSDPDGNSLTFTWSLIAIPSGSAAALSNPSAIKPTFTIDRPGNYTAQLVVSDGQLSSGLDTITISTVNSQPAAHAGPDQTAPVSATVTLDGSASSDVDGDSLTFGWSLVSKPADSQTSLANATSVGPSLVIDAPGIYVVQLIVNDGHVNSAADTVSVTTTNSAPVASAGPDQTVFAGATVHLDGSGSTDVDGNPLAYTWALTTKPVGSGAVFSSATVVKPTFAADLPGDYVAQLVVNDGTIDSAPDTVTISTTTVQNHPPVADPGGNQTVPLGALVQLDGSASSDPDGDGLSFKWSLLSVPAGSAAALSSAPLVNPTFVADRAGSYVAQLIVNDGTVDSSPRTVTISTQNSAPTANAGANQTVAVNATVQLDGSGSSDPDGTPLTYTWSLLSTPSGSGATVSNPTSVNPTFVADLQGVYVAQLIVSDGVLFSAPVTVTVTAGNPADLEAGFESVPANPAVGSRVDFSVRIRNLGPAATHDVSVAFKLPPGYSLISASPFIGTGTYDPTSGTWIIDFSSSVNFLDIAAIVNATGPYDLTATITHSPAPDPDLSNNSATVHVSPNPNADLQIAFMFPPVNPPVGSNAQFWARVSNQGPGVAANVTAHLSLPAGYTLIDYSSGYDPATGVWSIGPMVGGVADLVLHATVNQTGPYSVTASVSDSTAPDPDPSNNTATLNVSPNANADLRLAFISPPNGTYVPGASVLLWVRVSSNGPASATGIAVHFKVPAGYTAFRGGPSSGTYDATTGDWTIGSLVSGVADLSFDATVNATGPAQLIATITGSSQPDPDLTNNIAAPPPINRPPIANVGPDQTTATNALVSLDGTQSFDPDGDAFTSQWTFALRPINSLATLANANTATPSFVPDRGGHYIPQLTLIDSHGVASLSPAKVTITANELNHAPVIRSTPVTTTSVGQAYAYQVVAPDPDPGDTLTFSLSNPPAGMSIEPATGLIGWTPTAAQSGPQGVTLRVQDAGGLFATQTFAVQVSSDTEHAPIANNDSYQVHINESLGVNGPGVLANDHDLDGHPLSARLLTPPRNGSLSFTGDGSFTYTPFTLQPSEYVLADNVSLVARIPGVQVLASSGSPANAIDENLGTDWTTQFEVQPWIEVVLPEDVTVSQVQILAMRTVTENRKVTAGIVQLFAADGSELYNTGSFELPPPTRDGTFILPSVDRVRRVRFLPTAGERTVSQPDEGVYQSGIAELKVIGSTLIRRERKLEPNLMQLLPVAIQASSVIGFNIPEAIADDAPNTNWYAASLNPGEFIEATFPVDVTVSRLETHNASGRPDGFGTSQTFNCSGTLALFDAAGTELFNSGVLPVLQGGPFGQAFSVPVPNVGGVRRARVTIADCTGTQLPPGFSEFLVFGDTAVDTPAFSIFKKFQVLSGREIHSTPIVVNLTDDNGDGRIDTNDIPDIVVPAESVGNQLTGEITVVSGDDGRLLFTAGGPDLVSPWSEVAAGDLDGDGVPEIVAVHSDGNHLIAFEHTGAIRWISDANSMPRYAIGGRFLFGGAVSIANLDGAGRPEIIVGASVFDADGHLLGDGRALGGTSAGTNLISAISAIADIDLDDTPEIVAGPTAYRLASGQLTKVWQRTDRSDGYVAVANFDDDPQAEIVVVASGFVYMLNHDGSDAEVWNAPTHAPVAIPGGGDGGAPLIVDVDGDGVPEIGVAAQTRYTIFNRDGSVRWTSAIMDRSSYSTGSVAFDLDGDGQVEIIYRDQNFLRVFRGSDGVLLAKIPVGSATWAEEPVVTDVDNDGHADIVVSSDFQNQTGGTANTGVIVLQDVANKWTRTRRIWNQHSYHVTNVNEDATIPVHETPHWLVGGLNAFRINQFVPGETPDGTDSFTYVASDGTLDSNVATVRIAVRTPNGAPNFTSAPVANAAGDVPYVYAARASDPDAGDILTFSLPTAPAGMTIESSSGLIRWTPAGAQLGNHDVIVRVRDVRGLFAVQNYTVNVGTAIVVPDVVGQPQTNAEAAITGANLAVGAISTRHSPTVASGSVLSQTPQAGTHVAPSAPINLVVSSGPAPTGTVPDVVGQAQASAQADVVAAGFAVGAVTGQNNAAIPSGIVLNQAPAAGTTAASGSPVNLVISLGPPPGDVDQDHDGFTPNMGDCNDGSASIHPGAFDPPGDGIDQDCNGRDAVTGDTTPPTVTLVSPSEDAVVTMPVDVVGTATDANFLRYTVEFERADSGAFTVLGAGTTAVTGGVVARIDPTLLENGIYRLRLVAEDVNAQKTVSERAIVVEGQAKVGNFRISFKDLSILLAGVPITLVRTYDSRVKTKEDFGVGWTLDVKHGAYEHNRTPGQAWQILPGGLGLPCRNVGETASHVTQVQLSDYEFYTFALTLSDPRTLFGGCEATASFRPIGGRRSGATLEILDGTDVLYLNGDNQVVDPNTLTVYNPARVRLTTVDGRIFELERASGITRMQDLNGNSITITDAGITHSSGRSVSFERDLQHRIVRVTDPRGGVLDYTYDTNGDLVRVVDQNDAAMTFRYNGRHDLLEITDPLGRPAQRTEFDADGRMIAITDGSGHRTTIDHDLAARQEVLTDRRGNISVVDYDDRGNVVRRIDPLGHSTTMTFDARDNKLSETDQLGAVTTFTYDANDNLTTHTDALGHETSFVYDGQNRPVSVTDVRGGTSTFTYDRTGNLVQAMDPLGRRTTATYDSHGLLNTMANDRGEVIVTNQHDAFGQTVQQTDGLGHHSSFTYDASGHQTSQNFVVTDLAGNPTISSLTLEFDGRDRLQQFVDADGLASRRTYDLQGNLLSTTDRMGQTTSFEYDLQGNRVRTTRGAVTVQDAYDPSGNLAQRTDPAGRTTRYEYDALNRVTRIVHPDGSDIQNIYDAAGRLVAQINERGQRSSFEYDAMGRKTKGIDPTGASVTFAYDAAAHLVAQTDPNGNVTRYEYDAAGQRTKTTYPDGTSASVAYDVRGCPVGTTDAEGHTTQYQCDVMGRLARVVDPLGNATSYTFDERGDVTSQTDPNGHVTRWGYDTLRRVVSHTLPLGMRQAFTYTPDGRIASRTDFNGDIASFLYTDGRLTRAAYHDGTQVTLTYTADGERATMTDGSGTSSYTYDSRGRLAQVVNPTGATVAYGYDAASNITSVTGPSGSVSYSYDAANRVSAVVDPDGGTTRYTYDVAGNRTGVAYPNGVIGSYAFDSRNRITSLVYRASDGTELRHFAYTYSPAGQRSTVDESGGRHVEYAYDGLYRLTQENVTDSALGNTSVNYAYDAVGNRVARTGPGGVVVSTYDANDRLLTTAGAAFTYDQNGNLVARSTGGGNTAFAYDGRNRLSTIAGAGPAMTYEYDGDGVRIASAMNGAATQYLQDQRSGLPTVLEERDAGGSLMASYVRGLGLVSEKRGGNRSYYLPDALGTTRALTDATGALTDTFTYDAFGNLQASTGSTRNDFLFAGEQFDRGAGLYFLRDRYYDAFAGRFIGSDRVPPTAADPRTLHRYAYCGSNPVNCIDPSGQDWTLNSMAVAGAISGALIAATVVSQVAITARVYTNLPPNAFTFSGPTALMSGAQLSASPAAVLNKAPNPAIQEVAFGLAGVAGVGGVDVLQHFNSSGQYWVYGYVGPSVSVTNWLPWNLVESLTGSPLGGSVYAGLVWGAHKKEDYEGYFVSASLSGKFSEYFSLTGGGTWFSDASAPPAAWGYAAGPTTGGWTNLSAAWTLYTPGFVYVPDNMVNALGALPSTIGDVVGDVIWALKNGAPVQVPLCIAQNGLACFQ